MRSPALCVKTSAAVGEGGINSSNCGRYEFGAWIGRGNLELLTADYRPSAREVARCGGPTSDISKVRHAHR